MYRREVLSSAREARRRDFAGWFKRQIEHRNHTCTWPGYKFPIVRVRKLPSATYLFWPTKKNCLKTHANSSITSWNMLARSKHILSLPPPHAVILLLLPEFVSAAIFYSFALRARYSVYFSQPCYRLRAPFRCVRRCWRLTYSISIVCTQSRNWPNSKYICVNGEKLTLRIPLLLQI